MQYEEFVGHVQNRAKLGSTGEAVAAVRATLQTLGERLAGGEADHLAAQLPEEIGIYLREANAGQSFDLDEFLLRVAAKEPAELPDATYHARVVMEVLQQAVTPGQMDHVRDQLPDEYTPLFRAGSTGQMDVR